MAVYDIKKLSVRYGISEAGIRKFINENLGKINQSGIHVKKVGKSFTADEEAVKIIDQLRNVGVTVVEEAVSDDRILKLTEENSQLKTQLLLVMKELAEANKEAKTAYKELAESKVLQIQAVSAKEAELKSVKDTLTTEKEKYSSDLEAKETEINRLKKELQASQIEVCEALAKASEEKIALVNDLAEAKKETEQLRIKYEEGYSDGILQKFWNSLFGSKK